MSNSNKKSSTTSTKSLEELVSAKITQLENPPASTTATTLTLNSAKDFRAFVTGIFQEDSTSVEDKTKLLTSKYSQLLQDNNALTAERDKFAVQLAKASKLKSQMEQLCRELQKQNKAIIEESKKSAEEEQNKRQELSKKFHDTIQQISVKMEEQGEERVKLFKENEMLREKIRNFAEQYQIREKHFETQAKAKDLELQLLEAKLKQQVEIAAQESLRAQAYNDQINTLTAREKELSTQLAYYAEKFEQFQETLTKSNEIFTTFKQEMDRMSKTIKKSEKENTSLKKKCEQTDVALIELAEERNNYKKQVDLLAVQKKKLEDLCRVLQTERSQLKQQLEQHQTQTAAVSSEETPAPTTTKQPNIAQSDQ